MAVTGVPVPTPDFPDQSGSPPVTVVTVDVPALDGCEVLTRLKAYVVTLGEVPTLRHVFRDRQGNPLDITPYFSETYLDSVSQSPGDGETAQLILRSKEIVAPAGPRNPVLQIPGRVVDPTGGVVDFDLNENIVARAGIYQLSVCLSDQNNKTIKIENPVLWVERSLFVLDSADTRFNSGPPTINEIRMAIRDCGAAENLLLDDIEFKDDQLAAVAVRPLQYWNEIPPPIRPAVDSRCFPFREHWMQAIIGHLFVTAAHHYRRNQLPANAGGINVDDMNKEGPYLKMGMQMLEDWKQFVLAKKLEINSAAMMGTVKSAYGGFFQ